MRDVLNAAADSAATAGPGRSRHDNGNCEMPIESIHPAAGEVTATFEKWSAEATGRAFENNRLNRGSLAGSCETVRRAAVTITGT